MHHAYRQRGMNGSCFEPQAVPDPHGTGGTHWQRPRVVRLRRLRLLRQQHRPASSSRNRSDRAAVSDLGACSRSGFFARPVGSLVLGRVGDRIGRRALLTLSIALIGGATLILGLLPTYEQIGIAAPLLLMTMRVDPGLLARRRVHRIDGLHHRAVLAARCAASSAVQRPPAPRSASSSAPPPAWLINAHARAPMQVDAWGWRIPFIGERRVPDHRLLPAPRASRRPRRARRPQQERPPAARLADRRLAADRADLRHRRDDERGVLPRRSRLRSSGARRWRRPAARSSGAEFQLATTIGLFVVLFAKLLGGWLSDQHRPPKLMMA